MYKDKLGNIFLDEELNTMDVMDVEELELRYCPECYFEYS